MDNIYDDAMFNKQLNRLNSLLGQFNEFSYTTARKKHTDLFGEIINPGDIYFKRQQGQSFVDVLKLSRASLTSCQ